ncbi:gliding motility lipoprotein GldD [Lutibacter sp.]
MKNSVLLLLIATLLFSCSEEILPKPKPYLKLQYPIARYKKIETNCPYNFEISTLATVNYKNNCWLEIDYPPLKATIYITYRKVDNNLDEILREVDKLTYKHAVKADVIPDAKTFEYLDKKVFGKVNNVEGNVASNIQFSVTDSVKHVLSGSLYFYTKPNYDSIIPAIKYLEKDIMHLVETLEWK